MHVNETVSPVRIFISFSSKDKFAAREIMSGLRSQNFDFWDYSDEIDQMTLNDVVTKRLQEEIDRCDYFIALVSKNSTGIRTGHFTRFEVQYAVEEKKFHQAGRILTIELEGTEKSDYIAPYEPLKDLLHVDYISNRYTRESVQSYISVLKKICKATGRSYVPQIVPDPRLPFWEKFRDEVVSFAHANSVHIHLNGIMGEFNEYFKYRDFQDACDSITYFIDACHYLLPEYKMVYPWIVRAVTEHSLGRHADAKLSYESALKSDPGNPVALGGIGMVYQLGGDYGKAVEYFEKAVIHSQGIQAVSEKMNLVVSKISGRIPITSGEKNFMEYLDPDEVVAQDREELAQKGIMVTGEDPVRDTEIVNRFEDLREKVLLNKAYYFYSKASNSFDILSRQEYNHLMEKAYNIYKYQVPEEKISVAAHVIALYMTVRNLNKYDPADIIRKAIDRPDPEKKLDKKLLNAFLAEHYLAENDLSKSIEIYESKLINDKPGNRALIYYAIALRKKNSGKYKEICRSVLDIDKNGLPVTREDYYWHGFANYLLENTSRARYDYERSKGFLSCYSEIFDPNFNP